MSYPPYKMVDNKNKTSLIRHIHINNIILLLCTCIILLSSIMIWGQGGTVVTHSPPTSEVGGSNPGRYVGKLVVAYRWSAVSSIEP